MAGDRHELGPIGTVLEHITQTFIALANVYAVQHADIALPQSVELGCL